MPSPVEIVTGSLILSNVDQVLASLTQWHPRVDVLVDPQGQGDLVGNATFTLLGNAGGQSGPCAPGAPLLTAQNPTRVLSEPSPAGLSLSVSGRTSKIAPIAVNVAIIGWDPTFQAAPVQLSALNTLAVPAGPTGVVFGSIAWRPSVDVLQGPFPNDRGMGAIYQLWAVAGGIRALVAAGTVANAKVGAYLIRGYQGGASSYELDVVAPSVALGTAFGALIGQCPYGVPGGGGGVVETVRSSQVSTNLTAADYYLSMEPPAQANLTVTIDPNLAVGTSFEVKDATGNFYGNNNKLTITPPAGETIDLAASFSMQSPNPAGGTPGRSIKLTKVGTNWEIAG